MRPDEALNVRERAFDSELPDMTQFGVVPSVVSVREPDGKFIQVCLHTDSPTLMRFFVENWGAKSPSSPTENAAAHVYALRGDAQAYNLSPSLNGHRWFSRSSNSVLYFGNSSYTNLKITVRGLLAACATSDVLWVHGCALSVFDGDRSYGILMIGRSGAGKTTITSALRRYMAGNVRIVNDDFGPVSLKSGRISFTGEQRLHMKYKSVATLAPHINPTPISHLSENFDGDRLDPTARLLIEPSEVFGSNGFCHESSLDSIIVVGRDFDRLTVPTSSSQIISLIEKGEYSEYYKAPERFFNGSLFLINDGDEDRYRQAYRQLFDLANVKFVSNVETPESAARQVLETVLSKQRVDAVLR